MILANKTPAKIIFANGKEFIGYSFGAIGTTVGEVCFNTGMTGYQEILTDPSYYGQLVTMTYPHIGNYGINEEDIESNRIQCSGFIVKEETVVPSNYRSTLSLGKYLSKNNIIGIQGIDTRAITRMIRDEGAMNAVISSENLSRSELEKILKKAPNMEGLDLALKVTCKDPYIWDESISNAHYKIAVIDYGIKYNILRLLADQNCSIKVFPADITSKEIIEYNPDGIFLSNGPGDPSASKYAIQTVKELLGKKPIFGICLGHQILSLALGAKTFKLKFGHRGCNHPVKNLDTGAIEITSQNHGFAVDPLFDSKDITVTHINLNDNTIEGIRSDKYQAFSVQYHPESSPGPHDSRYLFKNFFSLIKSKVPLDA